MFEDKICLALKFCPSVIVVCFSIVAPPIVTALLNVVKGAVDISVFFLLKYKVSVL